MHNPFLSMRVRRSGLLYAAAVAAVPAVSAAPASAHVPPAGNWSLLFGDEFNSTAASTLDRAKWGYAYPWSQHGLADDSVEIPSAVSVSNGTLNFTATNTGQWYNNNWYNYSSGAVNTNGTSNFTYGYIEASQKMASQQGTWPAFWMLQGGWPPEIDIEEVPAFSANETSYNTAYHYSAVGTGTTSSAGPGLVNENTNLSASFNSYGVDWEPNSLTFYFNGGYVGSISGSQANIAQAAGMYLLLDMGVGGWPGEPASGSITTAAPAVMETDWVRVWQKSGTAQTNWTATAGGNWDDGSKWSGGIPTLTSTVAYFGAQSGSTSTGITVSWTGSRSVNGLIFDSPTKYTIGAAPAVFNTAIDGGTGVAWGYSGVPALMIAGADGVATSAETVAITQTANATAGTIVNARIEVPYSLLTLDINNASAQPITFNGDMIGTGALTFNSGSTVINGNDQTTGWHTFTNGAAVTLNGQMSAAAEFTIGPSSTVQANSNSTIVANAWLSVGSTAGGTGTLNLAGGALTANTDFNIGDVSGSSGIIRMTGGSIAATNFYLGKSGTATGLLVQSAGSIASQANSGGDWRIGGATSADAAAVGTYNISGGTFTTTTNFQVGAYGKGIVNQTGGTVTVGSYLSIGRWPGAVGVYNMASGSGTLTANTVTALIVGEQGTGTLLVGGSSHVNAKELSIANSDGTAATGTVVQTGGTITATAGVEFGAAAGATAAAVGIYNLAGGTLVTPQVIQNPLSSVTGTFDFNGGVLQPSAAETSIFAGITNLRVQAGGAFINTVGIHAILGQALTHDPALGTTVDGGLTKNGYATLTISATQGYTGVTTIDAGTLQLSPTINLLPVTSTVNIAIAGATFDLNGGSQTLANLNGVAGSLVTTGSATLTISDTAADTFAGNISGPGSLTKQAAGVLTLSGTNTYTGTTNVASGTLALPSGASMLSSSVAVAPGATFNLGGSLSFLTALTDNGTTTFTANTATTTLARSLGAITVGPAATLAVAAEINHAPRQVVSVPTVTVNATGTLNLANNDLDLTAESLSAATAQVAAGYGYTAGGTWTGRGGISSSTAAADSTHLTALGVIQNNQAGTPIYSATNPFDGTAPGPSDVLVKYTYFGDANLDGKVDGSDYSLIDAGYAGTLTGWYNGDFNYDGVVDGSDYTLIDNAFNTQDTSYTAGGTAQVATETAQVAAAPAAVPEPACLSLLAVAGVAALRRRRQCSVSRQA
jgi:autotransporter-associated beta strand protein